MFDKVIWRHWRELLDTGYCRLVAENAFVRTSLVRDKNMDDEMTPVVTHENSVVFSVL